MKRTLLACLCAVTLSFALPAQSPAAPTAPAYPQGTLVPKVTFTSHIYEGMTSPYWVYTPAGYDPAVPAPLMVFQDGGGYLSRTGDLPMLNTLDKLTAEHRIPVIVYVFTDPGEIADRPDTALFAQATAHGKLRGRDIKQSMRSIEYDTVSDRYDRFLHDEVLAQVAQHYKLRPDAYSRAISGLSSGGIAAFNAAWQQPGQFSRVITWIGSFTAIQWQEDPAVREGGQDFPAMVRRGPHRNLRVWVEDGAGDLDNVFGDWPLANVEMANALKFAGYDFRFSFGAAGHSAKEGFAEFETEMTWLWRNYDPAKTAETYTQDPEEKAKGPFTIKVSR